MGNKLLLLLLLLLFMAEKWSLALRLDPKREDLPLSAVLSFLLISTFHGGVPSREFYFSLLKGKQ